MVIPLEVVGKKAVGEGGSRTTAPDLMGLEDGPALVLSSSSDFDELD